MSDSLHLRQIRAGLEGGPLEPLLPLFSAVEIGQRTDATLGEWLKEVSAEVAKLWEDSAERRDELHALANRVENLTRAVTTEPAEVAAKIVTDTNREQVRRLHDGD